MPITIKDIARESGYSIATVSRVLNHSSYPVKDTVREKILETADAMNYRPNLVARSLRTDQTNTVGILVDDLLSPFTPPVVRGIQDQLKENNFISLIVNSDWNIEQEQAGIESLLSRPVDGIIFVEYSHLTSSEALTKANKPGVFVHRLFGTPIKNSVVPDDNYGASLAVDHLIHLDHRSIAYINGPENWHNAKERLEGYKKTLKRHEIPLVEEWIQPGDWEVEGGYRGAQNLLQLSNRPTAIFAANDLMALGAIYAIQDAGFSVPDDIAVVGYDNREFTWIVRPNITTVTMPVYEMGRIAAEILLQQIADGANGHEEVKVIGELVIRDTCGASESEKTDHSFDRNISLRRVLLNKDPDN
ncbi:MAG: LacI family DNA-binding transcriptional regulator [Anaerolineales bacterium]|jgi:LacI family transcriptional regulator